jgi:SAM-dependent methyltransferase
MSDDIARYSKERWEDLAAHNVVFSRPMLDMTEGSAREYVDPRGMLGDVTGRDILCLAGGGGQQSAALALLGACVTVFDLSETQLERDREAAAHYGVTIQTVQGDMRDLSAFAGDSFDVVHHGHSLTFVPDARPVFAEAARVLRPGGLYYTHFCNPAFAGLDERDWNGEGYVLRRPFVEGTPIEFEDATWGIWEDGREVRVEGPHEFRHSLASVVGGLIERGFALLGLWENADSADPEAEPGSWDHFCSIAPPYLELWARLEGKGEPQ